MSTYADKPSSLIERKKQQWAREREELAGLSAPWGFVNSTNIISSEHVTKLATSTPNAEIFLRRESTASRRQSLPPIYQKHVQSYAQNERYDKEMGGETSGYGSDNPNNTPEYFQQTAWNQNLGYESSSSARDDRAKWGERGVGVGKFWDSQEIKYNNKMDDTPGWVKRGLQEGTELIVSNTSPAESPEQDYGDQRPYTSSSMSQTRTYIRGQNNPVDPVELAQRELKRQVARIHQEAIKQQLEEREQKRREERERQIREEREEEVRIERQQEVERQRRDREQQIMFEKQLQETKRKEALQEAIKLAEKEAKEQKMRHKMLKQVNNININENVIEKDKVVSPRPIMIINNKEDEDNKSNSNKANNKSENEINNNQNNTNNNSLNNLNNEKIENNLNSINSVVEKVISMPQEEASTSNVKVNNTENAPRIVPTPFDNYSNFPFAILMPTFTATGPNGPIAVPMQINTETRSSTPLPRTENRVLTPTLYRQRRFCDSSTQTDKPEENGDQNREIKSTTEKLTNLELADETKNKNENKLRACEKRENSSDRPKWGANRPPTRYMKQSEKDPFYQRKKIRQKIRQIKLFDDKNNNYSPHSSDDSQMGSPRLYRKKGYIEKRRTRALWQKGGHLLARNMQVYHTEIIPLESDTNNIYYTKNPNCVKCCCGCRSNQHKYTEEVKVVDILKIEHTPRAENDNSLPDCINTSSVDREILDKLTSLHNGLMTKQEQWQNSPCTPSLSSPNRITEVNR